MVGVCTSARGERGLYTTPDLASYLRASVPIGQWSPTSRRLHAWVRRDLLADPFDPFKEMRIGKEKIDRLAAPLACYLVGRARSGASLQTLADAVRSTS